MTYTPTRTFAAFGDSVRDFERSDDVLDVLTDIMNQLDHNIGAYIGGKFIALWLREGEAQMEDESDLDLLFVNQVDGYLDIVIRQRAGFPRDGGSLGPLQTIKLTDEIADGYRVIIGVADDGTETRYEMVGGRYLPINPLPTGIESSMPRRSRMS